MASDVDADLAALAERMRTWTVRIHEARGRSMGSGVIWTGDGLVVTNSHVVRGARTTVEFPNGRFERAALIARDPDCDLALLRLASELEATPVVTRSAAQLRPGELVAAVGNPLGLSGALTLGTVQRVNAKWVIADVRLAPGNSGGPLADTSGRIVGINSMIARGLALAVPADRVVAFLRAHAGEKRAQPAA